MVNERYRQSLNAGDDIAIHSHSLVPAIDLLDEVRWIPASVGSLGLEKVIHGCQYRRDGRHESDSFAICVQLLPPEAGSRSEAATRQPRLLQTQKTLQAPAHAGVISPTLMTSPDPALTGHRPARRIWSFQSILKTACDVLFRNDHATTGDLRIWP